MTQIYIHPLCPSIVRGDNDVGLFCAKLTKEGV